VRRVRQQRRDRATGNADGREQAPESLTIRGGGWRAVDQGDTKPPLDQGQELSPAGNQT